MKLLLLAGSAWVGWQAVGQVTAGDPVDAVFLTQTHRQLHQDGGDGHGDNWCQTWADDDHVYTYMDDGFGWIPRDRRNRQIHPFGIGYSCRLWRIIDTGRQRRVQDIPNQPDYRFPTKWFGFGLVSINGVLYCTITHVGGDGTGWGRPFNGFKLLKSPDHGITWFLHDGRPIDAAETSGLSRSTAPADNFIWKANPTPLTDRRGVTLTGHAFASVYPVQCGRNNGLAKDDYVYWYSPLDLVLGPSATRTRTQRLPRPTMPGTR